MNENNPNKDKMQPHNQANLANSGNNANPNLANQINPVPNSANAPKIPDNQNEQNSNRKQSDQFTDSIFDSPPPEGNFKLWVACSESHPMHEPLSKSVPILTGIVGKRSSSKSQKNQIRDRFYVLTDSYLFFKKKEGVSKISGFLDHKWARMEVHKEEY